MLSLEHITMGFGDRVLFEDVSHTIGPHDRIGLVGSNGSGKSTLMKIVAGLMSPDSGRVARARYVTVGYLPQDGVIASGKTLAAEAETAFENVIEVRSELDEVQARMETLDPAGTEYADILEVFGELQHKLEDLDAFRMKSKAERVLMGLGFGVSDFDRQCGEFSGGWQMRIAMAKLLLKEPSVLLLDEPTNHLDLDSLRWLEEYLRSYNGAVILVSHDRAFLDNLTLKTLGLSGGKVDFYAGNFSFFETERSKRQEQAVAAARNQQKQREQTQRFIDRFRYKATKARQVQSRIKMLEKMEDVEVPGTEKEIAFHFPKPEPSGAVVIEMEKISKSYGLTVVFTRLDCRIERGDRIAVVGPNGAGKSTFARLLAGDEEIDSGRRTPGYHAIISYFGQHQAEELDEAREVLEVVEEVAPAEFRPRLRTMLGSFLFHGDDVFKKVSVLSGGEKSRLALAKMLLRPANLLVMDEPTNHLDMQSKQILQNALMEYEGTIVIVSHDRAFLDPIVSKVFEFTPGRMREFPGTVSEYLEKREREEAESVNSPAVSVRGERGKGLNTGTAGSDGTAAPVSGKERKRLEAEIRQKRYRELKPWKEKLTACEKEIERMEARKKELEAAMANPDSYRDGDEARNLAWEYHEIGDGLERAYGEWDLIAEKIASITAVDR